MRRGLPIAALAAAGVVLAIPAVAKEGVRAKLDRPVRLGAAPGTMIRVRWHLIDEHGRPFGASGIYLRVSRCGQRPRQVAANALGHGGYSARVRIPRHGISKLMVGLKGVQITDGHQRRADAFFQFDPPLHRDCT